MDINRILTGQSVTRAELIAAGVLMMVWFLMDLAQWIDWFLTKIYGGCV